MEIAVLGGGIQGICVALALVRKPKNSIVIFDKQPNFFTQASIKNEGKIHLGFVYAKDTTFRTADKLLQDALLFAPTMESLVEAKINWREITSTPFHYLIADDSMVNPDRLLEYYAELNERHRNLLKNKSLHYLGNRHKELFNLSKTYPAPLQGIAKSVYTEERSVLLSALKRLLLTTIKGKNNIKAQLNHEVESIHRNSRGFIISGRTGDQNWSDSFDVVINCLWDSRLKIDEQMGLLPTYKWVYRLKYRVLAELPKQQTNINSLTIVQGSYGDIVTYKNHPLAYMSWYPACLQGWSQDIQPPAAWESARIENAGTIKSKEIAFNTLKGFDSVLPGISMASIKKVSAGVIYSRGNTDITDHQSELHERHDIGVQAMDGYFTINTGKFTSAPSNAIALANMF